MKKIIIGLIIAIILGILCAFMLQLFQNNTANIKQDENTKLAEEENTIDNNRIELVSTSVSEVKTSPNATIIYEIYYKQCGHTMINQIEIPKELVNLNKVEVEEKYKDYQIKEFTSGNVVLSKQDDGICEEHYVLREDGGYIVIYNIDKNGKENLKEITTIVTKYLPDADIERLREGIKVIGKQKLNATIEDYE